mgnify:CR=1 FL=1
MFAQKSRNFQIVHTATGQGIDLGRRMGAPQLYALTSPLLTTASGAKMGKTAAGAVWLNADMLPVYDYWQYWRNTEDADVGRFLKLFTDLLEAHGYQVNVTELVGWEHSLKNELILASFKDLPRARPARRLNELMQQLGLVELQERFFVS